MCTLVHRAVAKCWAHAGHICLKRSYNLRVLQQHSRRRPDRGPTRHDQFSTTAEPRRLHNARGWLLAALRAGVPFAVVRPAQRASGSRERCRRRSSSRGTRVLAVHRLYTKWHDCCRTVAGCLGTCRHVCVLDRNVHIAEGVDVG